MEDCEGGGRIVKDTLATLPQAERDEIFAIVAAQLTPPQIPANGLSNRSGLSPTPHTILQFASENSALPPYHWYRPESITNK